MPNGGDGSLLKRSAPSGHFSLGWPFRPLFWLRDCTQTSFRCLPGTRAGQGIRLGAWGFQKIKQPLRRPPVCGANTPYFYAAHQILDVIVHSSISENRQGAGTSRQISHTSVWERTRKDGQS